MFADDGLFHLLLAPALGEARPLQGDGASERDELLVQSEEDGGQADARGQEDADQRYGNQYYSCAGPVQIRRRGAMDLRPQVSARREQRAAQPYFSERQIEQRRRGQHQHAESDQLRLQELEIFAPEAIPAQDQQRRRKEHAGESEKADEEPGHRRAVVADPIGDRGVGGGIER